MASPALEVHDLVVRFVDIEVLSALHLQVGKGEIVAIVGANGSGKTTLLRSICGLQDISSGSISLNGREVSELSCYRRNIGMVFQDSVLLPQLDVAGNLALGIPRKKPRSEVKNIISKALDDLNLSGYERRDVSTLSGGEKERIALMRALLAEPEFLLLDEPLVSQDTWNREKLGSGIRELLKSRGVAALLVTHDAQEAERISDRVVMIEELQKRGEEAE